MVTFAGVVALPGVQVKEQELRVILVEVRLAEDEASELGRFELLGFTQEKVTLLLFSSTIVIWSLVPDVQVDRITDFALLICLSTEPTAKSKFARTFESASDLAVPRRVRMMD